MVTQSDVAKKAGVSFMSVSRVINNKGNVKEETRKRIEKAIKELNYHPSSIGRGLNMNRIFTLGVIIPIPFESKIFLTSFYIKVLAGIEKACKEYNYEILISPKASGRKDDNFFKPYFERKVDGLILIAPEINDEHLKVIENNKINCVIISSIIPSSEIPYVDSDNVKGGTLAVEYLLSKGHKRIGHITGLLKVTDGKDRLNGYKKALKANSIKYNKDLVVEGDFSEESGYMGMMRLLALAERPEAVFIGNDSMAIGAYKACREKGLLIPQDISIIGYDDSMLSEHLNPPLTTIRQDSSAMGYAAARKLIAAVSGDSEEVKSDIFDVSMIERQSVK